MGTSLQILIFLFISTTAFAADLEVFIDGKAQNKLTQKHLFEKIPNTTVKFYNDVIRETESFDGPVFRSILFSIDNAYGAKFEEIEFITENGYRPFVPMLRVAQAKSILSYKRTNNKPFTRQSRKQKKWVPLGPWYLVWDLNKTEASRKIHFSSIYQIKGINLISRETTFGESKKGTLIELGQRTYKRYCLSCHALDGKGGDISFDLKQKQILKKKGEKWVLKYILNPEKVNPDTKMLPLPQFKNRLQMAKGVVELLNQ
jgi:mono/diheme cytochrome c family protein